MCLKSCEGLSPSLSLSLSLSHQCLLQLWYVKVECLVDVVEIEDRTALDTVQELTAGQAHLVRPEVPIKEHPGWDDPLVVTVTVITVVLPVELAQLGLTKNCREKHLFVLFVCLFVCLFTEANVSVAAAAFVILRVQAFLLHQFHKMLHHHQVLLLLGRGEERRGERERERERE